MGRWKLCVFLPQWTVCCRSISFVYHRYGISAWNVRPQKTVQCLTRQWAKCCVYSCTWNRTQVIPVLLYLLSQLLYQSVSQSVSRLTSQLVSQSIGRSVSLLVSQSVGQSVVQSVIRLMTQSVHQLVSQSVTYSVKHFVSLSISHRGGKFLKKLWCYVGGRV